MENSIFLILAIIIVVSIWVLVSKYVLYPLFLKPKIRLSEIINFLDKKQCAFVEYGSLTNKDKERVVFNTSDRLLNLITVKSHYKIIGFSQGENRYKIYWIEIQSCNSPFGKRVLNFIEEKDFKILNELQKEYISNIIVIKDKCPACNKVISSDEIKCKDCGLNLI